MVAREKLRAEKEWRGSAAFVVVSVVVGIFLSVRWVRQRPQGLPCGLEKEGGMRRTLKRLKHFASDATVTIYGNLVN